MKYSMTLAWILCALVTGSAGAMAQTATTDDEVAATLSRLQTTYQTELGKIDDERDQRNVTLRAQYVRGLDSLQATMQQEGQLEPTLAVRKERERFEEAKSVTAGTMSEVAELARLQTGYLEALDSIEVDRARKLLDLAAKYDRSLANLQTRATKGGDLEGAMAVREEREGLATRPEISSAHFIVAEEEAAQQRRQEAIAAKETTVAEAAKPNIVLSSSSRTDPKKRIRERFGELAKALKDDDMDTSVTYVDPQFVERKGTQIAKGIVRAFGASYVRALHAMRVDLDAGKVEVLDETHARNTPRVWVNGWKDGKPMYWVEREGEWYVDMEKREENSNRGDPSRTDHPRQPPPFKRGFRPRQAER